MAPAASPAAGPYRPVPARERRTTETKAAFKTTELIAYVAAIAAVLLAALILDESDAGGLGARQAWLDVTFLMVGYMISRGLAKSGSRDSYWDDDAAPGTQVGTSRGGSSDGP